MSVTPENPVFPNAVLPKTSVFIKRSRAEKVFFKALLGLAKARDRF